MVRHVTDKQTGETRKMYSADKTVRANMLIGHKESAFHLPADIFEFLGLMDEAGGSATAKFKRMDQRANRADDRVRGAMRYAGAPSTIRYSSLGLQVHNFRRDVINTKDDGFEPQFVIDQILRGEIMKDKKGKPLPVMNTLGRLLRSAIIPEKGKKLVVGDWASVESRMTAWLSGDETKLNLFRKGEDVYCHEASNIFNRLITPEDKYERSVGKVTDLALGFLGGVGALLSMATQYGVYIDPAKAQDIVDAYRAAHPKIVAFGNALMAAANRAVTYPDKWIVVGKVGYYFCSSDRALYCQLPGNRNVLRYPDCRFELRPMPWDKNELRPQLTALKAAFTPKAGAKEWARHGLWRGVMLENVAQATCAQRLRECEHECDHQDLSVIFTVHDEIILEEEIAKAAEAKRKLQIIMEFVPDYLKGLPLVAIPTIMTRYGK
jgi:DNA polymerase